ncbi:MAG: hypothetical protein ACPGOY_07105, partial [Rhodospirillaceae bacterium]
EKPRFCGAFLLVLGQALVIGVQVMCYPAGNTRQIGFPGIGGKKREISGIKSFFGIIRNLFLDRPTGRKCQIGESILDMQMVCKGWINRGNPGNSPDSEESATCHVIGN